MQSVYLHSLAMQINLIWVIWFPKFTAKSLEEGILVESCTRVLLKIKKQWMCMCIFIYTYIWASQVVVVLLLLSRFSCVRLVATPWTACSLPGSAILVLVQARVPEWGALAFSASDASSKESACQWRKCKRHEFNPWFGNISRRRKWQPTPVFLIAEFHGQRSLTGYNPWYHKELVMIEQLTLSYTHIHIYICVMYIICYIKRFIIRCNGSHDYGVKEVQIQGSWWSSSSPSQKAE